MSQTPDEPGSVTRNLQKLQQGTEDKDAQHDLFKRYYRRAVDTAWGRLRRQQVVDASDAAVSVWDTIFRGLHEGRYACRDREEFEELLGKITYHKAVNLFNWVKKSQRHPADKLENEEILRSFHLDENHRVVAELFYVEGQTVEQIAASLAVSTEDVDERLTYVRRWLQKHRYRPRSHADSGATLQVPGGEGPLDALLLEELILSLDEKLRETVLLKLQGLENNEIADRLDVTERQVQRRLKLVRSLLTTESDEEENAL